MSEKAYIPPPVQALPPQRTHSRSKTWRKLTWLSVVVAGFYVVSQRTELPRRFADKVALPVEEVPENHLWAISMAKSKPRCPKKLEHDFLQIPNEASALAGGRHYTSKPHMAGTEGDLDTAKDVLALMQEELNITKPDSTPIFDAGSPESQKSIRGISSLKEPIAWIDTYHTLLNTPLDRSLDILDTDGNSAWSADLKEKVDDDTDPIAYKYADAIPTFHGFSRGGTAQGPVIYAHYGRKEDYDSMVAQGANFTGKIVLVQYGGILRGLKIKFAQELGAVGVLMYDDPRNDGAVTVANGYKPYPHGPARNPTAVQRGSVQFIADYPGDPTTPGYPSYPNATRTEGGNIPSIPSLPISWENAQRLLEEIEDLTQTSSRIVKLVNNVDYKINPIWNTMAVIPGHIKNEAVVLGNHRDAWVLGAADPTSGTISLNEVIKGYGALWKSGWRPMRTIIFASWDAEEYGLIGSTEWGEDFADWISENVVAYINVDGSASGSTLGTAASPSLSDLAINTAKSLKHPTDPKRTMWDARKDVGQYSGPVAPEVQAMHDEAKKVSDHTDVGRLGSGSDFTVFLERLGVASVMQAFGGTLNDPVYHYHSIYDSHHWMATYGDKGFVRHVAIAKSIGLMGLKLSESIILPINTTRYCEELSTYVDEIEELASTADFDVDLAPLRKSIKKLTKSSLALEREKRRAEKEFIRQLRKLRHGKGMHRRLRKLAKKLGCKIKKCWRNMRGKPDHRHAHAHGYAHHHVNHAAEMTHVPRKFLKAALRVQKANKKLSGFEGGFISSEGIKDREWYKHLGVAAGKNLGYGATILPSLHEAIALDKNATIAKGEVARLEAMFKKMTKALAK